MFEINLVPDIKHQAIKAIKLRNLIFFICIVVAIASGALIAMLGSIKAGQDIAMAGQNARLEKLSSTLGSFDDLDELLTIQSQLKDLSVLNGKKTTLSRIFNVVDTLLPTNGDTITISELNVNLDESKISFDAQARANVEPRINFNVLNAFKHSMEFMRYDYGRYVDEEGSEIPTLCVDEKLMDNGQVVALWARGAAGCDPSDNPDGVTASNTEAQEIFARAAEEPEATEKTVMIYTTEDGKTWRSLDDVKAEYGQKLKVITKVGDEEPELPEKDAAAGYKLVTVEEKTEWSLIYRTPQFGKWYEKDYVGLDGTVSGVPHFESACITYNGVEGSDGAVKWSSENSCDLVPQEITVMDAADGRNADGEMVLRFSAVVTFDPNVFSFNNKHMLTMGPAGKIDVTDSYLQIEGIFEERSEGWKEEKN